MPELAPLRDETLTAFLARRARGASDLRLALDLVGGVIVAGVAVVSQPPAWPLLASAATCFSAYGAWGIADREMAERDGAATDARLRRALRVARASAVAVGALAGGVLLFGTLMLMLGTWIS